MILQEAYHDFNSAQQRAKEIFDNGQENVYIIKTKTTAEAYHITTHAPYLLKDESIVGMFKTKTL